MVNNTQPRWSNQTKIIVALIILAAFIFIAFRFQRVLAPIVIAVILAFILTPLVRSLNRHLNIHRAWVIFLIYILLLVTLGLFLWLIIPQLIRQISAFLFSIVQMFMETCEYFQGELELGGFIISSPKIYTQIISSIRQASTPMVGRTLNAISVLVQGALWAVLTLIISFYFIKDHKKTYAGRRVSPPNLPVRCDQTAF